ncbi:Exosome complex component rrp42 [Sporothrix stenoceras]|uniref:Ribosomal RNA-processing protein 42 n=1 Tax=Sporothrix stenoceras TaxID=5173 RepID=A0ABR3ZN22_9PEZI
MATTQHVLLSPAELAFLHTSLAQQPPIRPDGRTPAQFRPLRAETGMLPGANGSARICFSDGTEAIVGVKAQVERTRRGESGEGEDDDEDDVEDLWGDAADDDGGDGEGTKGGAKNGGGGAGSGSGGNASPSWVEVTVEIPGVRDDDASTVFLGALLAEALLADGGLTQALRINRRFHWKLFLDVLLISPPLSYPLPLLSLTTHLALLATRLPRLVSEGDEDPFFDDDWDASTFLYAKEGTTNNATTSAKSRPPITLLVMTVGDNILFDPTAEELAVANAVLAVSVGQTTPSTSSSSTSSLRLLAIRTIDPPSRLTAPGTPYNTDANKPKPATTTTGPAPTGTTTAQKDTTARLSSETEEVYGVWRAPRGGAKVALLAAMTHKVLEKGGVADEVFAGLDGVEIV